MSHREKTHRQGRGPRKKSVFPQALQAKDFPQSSILAKRTVCFSRLNLEAMPDDKRPVVLATWEAVAG